MPLRKVDLVLIVVVAPSQDQIDQCGVEEDKRAPYPPTGLGV
jgi:hypothetical protein